MSYESVHTGRVPNNRPSKSSSGLWALLIVMLILLIGVIAVIVVYLLMYKPGGKCSGVMLDSSISGRVAGSSHIQSNKTQPQLAYSGGSSQHIPKTPSAKASGADGKKSSSDRTYIKKHTSSKRTDGGNKTYAAGASCYSSNSSQKGLQHLPPRLGSARMEVPGNQLISLGSSGLKNHLNPITDTHGVKVQGLKGISPQENLRVVQGEKLQTPVSTEFSEREVLEHKNRNIELSIKARKDPINASQHAEQMGASVPVTRIGMQAAQAATTQIRGEFETPNFDSVFLDDFFRASVTLPVLSATPAPWGNTYAAAAATASQACTVASTSPISPQTM